MLFQLLTTVDATASADAQIEGLLFGLIKLMFLVGAFLYLAFAAVVLRQIKIMRETLVTSFSGVLRLLGWLHLIAAILVLLLFFVIL